MTFRSKLPEGEREAARAARRLKRLRDRHHVLARMLVSGMPRKDISERLGYSTTYISQIQQDPAFVELMAGYRHQLDEAFVAGHDAYYELLRQNQMAAEWLVHDRLEDAIENDEPIPLKDLLSISRDAADRTGYGRKSMQVNVNVDFAARLDRAVRRSKAGVEAIAQPAPATPSIPAPALSPVDVFGGGPKLIELTASPQPDRAIPPPNTPDPALAVSFSDGLRRRRL